MFEVLQEAFSFSSTQLSLHIAVLFSNILLLIFSAYIFSFFNRNKREGFGLTLFRFVNISFLLLHTLDLSLLFFNQHFEHFFLRLALTLLTVYTALFIFNMLSFLSRKKFGKVKELDDKNYYTDSYSSRIFDILGLVFIIIITLYTIINIWEWTSLLETTGIFGLLAAFLALTNQIWAPDLYYGLVILNSKLIEDGDVITIGDYDDEYIINKVTFIYTTLLDIRNNHRTLIKNSQLIERKIDNLSKRASTDGLRIKLSYKIGYASDSKHKDYHERIREMFQKVQEEAIKEDLEFNHHKPFEVFLFEAGDHALEYHLFFYLNNLPKTKITKNIRSILLQTPLLINEMILMASYEYNIDLSTPVIIKTTP